MEYQCFCFYVLMQLWLYSVTKNTFTPSEWLFAQMCYRNMKFLWNWIRYMRNEIRPETIKFYVLISLLMLQHKKFIFNWHTIIMLERNIHVKYVYVILLIRKCFTFRHFEFYVIFSYRNYFRRQFFLLMICIDNAHIIVLFDIRDTKLNMPLVFSVHNFAALSHPKPIQKKLEENNICFIKTDLMIIFNFVYAFKIRNLMSFLTFSDIALERFAIVDQKGNWVKFWKVRKLLQILNIRIF